MKILTFHSKVSIFFSSLDKVNADSHYRTEIRRNYRSKSTQIYECVSRLRSENNFAVMKNKPRLWGGGRGMLWGTHIHSQNAVYK